MRVAVFSSKPYDENHLIQANKHNHHFSFFESHLDETTVALSQGFDAVCCFVNDTLNADVIKHLEDNGIKLIAMRCAGFNNVDLEAAQKANITVTRVPEYSPYAVAEHAVALILALNRNIHRAYNRVRENNYALDGLMGFDLHGKTIGVIGTGKIGLAFIKIMRGFGCTVNCYDPYPNPEITPVMANYVGLEKIWTDSDIVSLHCPLMDATNHMINQETLAQMKDGVTLINTSRGGLIDTGAVISALKSGKIGNLGLDVYEEEAELFFENNSNKILYDDQLARLLSFLNVIVTGHQAFFTAEALTAIAQVTLNNIDGFTEGNFDTIFQVNAE
ncbi:2-hydroxyacid dehydrogenase [Reinekea marina]|uniref:2-hydroxyacid dehydrogenase n=1 Tax=Reinekea marina TaxID=1310421 RepID=A0ABV7WTS2_9GAMM|nr:2-hydroxyacid dehydrogenase [Reinekea marina]MDN3649757.1 2-hydroxyacid dehydrogenase [Reinekea marina]